MTLTSREQQILLLLAQGLANKEIGQQLNLSEGTVKVYTAHLFPKIKATNRLGAALWAIHYLLPLIAPSVKSEEKEEEPAKPATLSA